VRGRALRALAVAGLLGAASLARGRAAALLPGPALPPADRLVGGPYRAQDTAFVGAGARRLAADVAWVQLLQYLGATPIEEEHHESFPDVLPMTLRIVRLDPGFLRAYAFGATLLAWYGNADHTEEALALLREGRANNPEHWPFTALLAAVGFKQRARFAEMAEELSRAVRHPDCPAIVKSILANAYKANGRYAEALALWLDIVDSPDGGDYVPRAEREVPWLRARLAASRGRR
jgi:tetratricopeptide (TPR) repeat protein